MTPTNSEAPALEVDISIQEPEWESLPDISTQIETAVRTAVTLAPMPERIKGKTLEISIVLANDDLMHVLNREYREKDNPTNVLSFASIDSEEFFIHDTVALGDVMLGFQTIKRESVEQEKFLKDHILHLAVHGTLHLLGYDHRHESDAIIMEALEIRILEKLGVQNPYTEKLIMP